MDRRGFLKGLLATAVVVVVDPQLPKPPAPLTPVLDKLTFDEIAMTTLKNYRPIFADNITEKRLINWGFNYDYKSPTDLERAYGIGRGRDITDDEVRAIPIAAAFAGMGSWPCTEDVGSSDLEDEVS